MVKESELISKCLNNERAAQKKLYLLYQKSMYNIALRIVKSDTLACDVLQESFIQAFTNLSKFRAESTFGAWLKRIVVNQSLNHLKKENKFTELRVEKSYDCDELEFEEDETEMVLNSIKENMRNLPDGARTIFSLFYFEGFDHKEISELCGITTSTVKSQLNYARKLIRASLTKKHAS
jgi:RNA polymerase sigma factor (sigma-70 family)